MVAPYHHEPNVAPVGHAPQPRISLPSESRRKKPSGAACHRGHHQVLAHWTCNRVLMVCGTWTTRMTSKTNRQHPHHALVLAGWCPAVLLGPRALRDKRMMDLSRRDAGARPSWVGSCSAASRPRPLLMAKCRAPR
jgi:hypothetical protein